MRKRFRNGRHSNLKKPSKTSKLQNKREQKWTRSFRRQSRGLMIPRRRRANRVKKAAKKFLKLKSSELSM